MASNQAELKRTSNYPPTVRAADQDTSETPHDAAPVEESISAKLEYSDDGALSNVLCGIGIASCTKKKKMYTEHGDPTDVCEQLVSDAIKRTKRPMKDLTLELQRPDGQKLKLYGRPGAAGHFYNSENGKAETRGQKAAPAALAIPVAAEARAGVGRAADVHAYIEGCPDVEILKAIKKTLSSRLKALHAGKPEKSYQKKTINGRVYWYECWWDRKNKKKVERYYGKNPPPEAR
jgi:hypothetical protein